MVVSRGSNLVSICCQEIHSNRAFEGWIMATASNFNEVFFFSFVRVLLYQFNPDIVSLLMTVVVMNMTPSYHVDLEKFLIFY